MQYRRQQIIGVRMLVEVRPNKSLELSRGE